MTNIRITWKVHQLLREYGEGRSFEETLVKLLDESVPPAQTYDSGQESTGIQVREETLERLKRFKLTSNEGHSDTILRLLMDSGFSEK